MNFMQYFLLFIMYSVLGWFVETIYASIDTKKLANRGFLIGPYCPIYGYGCLAIVLLLTKYMENPLILFGMSIIICSVLEFFTSYILEKIFNTRWWDYSDKKYNLNGRICLETMLPFGILGTLMMYFVNPFFTKLVKLLNGNTLYIVFTIILILFLIDNIVSFVVAGKYKKELKPVQKDETETIKKYTKKLFENNILHKRLIEAFPNLKEKLLSIRRKVKNNEIRRIKK